MIRDLLPSAQAFHQKQYAAARGFELGSELRDKRSKFLCRIISAPVNLKGRQRPGQVLGSDFRILPVSLDFDTWIRLQRTEEGFCRDEQFAWRQQWAIIIAA